MKNNQQILSENLTRLLKSEHGSNKTLDFQKEEEILATEEETRSSKQITSTESSTSTDEETELNQQPFDLRTKTCLQRNAVNSFSSNKTTDSSRDFLLETTKTNSVNETEGKDFCSCSARNLMLSLNYLRRHRLFCDISFEVESKIFYAHRVVMASSSEVFKETYLEEMRKNKQKNFDVYPVKNMSSNIFEMLLEFIYTGELKLNDMTANLLLEAGSRFKVVALIQKCKDYVRLRNACQKQDQTNVGVFWNFPSVLDQSWKKQLHKNDYSNLTNEDEEPEKEMGQPSSIRRGSDSNANDCFDFQKRPRFYSHISNQSNNQYMSNKRVTMMTQNKEKSDNFGSSSTFKKNSSNSRTSEDKLLREEINQRLFNNCSSQAHHQDSLSTFKQWMLAISSEEDMKNAHQSNFLQCQESINENPWCAFVRDRLFNKDISKSYGSTPWFSNPFSIHGQFLQKKLFFNQTLPNYSQNGKAYYGILNANKNDKAEETTPASSKRKSKLSPVRGAILPMVNLQQKKEENIATKLSQDKPKHKTDVSSKPYSCPLCDAQFNRPANLKTHMRIHSGEKPYKCNTCGARFVQVAHLRAHVLIHTGEKPYPCNVCGTSFRHLQTLKSHLRIHTGEKPYSCEKCHVQFRHKSQLRLHLRTKHGVQTNTKKTYKQVPGLKSADISAHIKKAQEAAKMNNNINSKHMISPGCFQLQQNTLLGSTFNQQRVPDSIEISYIKNDNQITEQLEDTAKSRDQQNYKLNVCAGFAKLESIKKNIMERDDNVNKLERNITSI